MGGAAPRLIIPAAPLGPPSPAPGMPAQPQFALGERPAPAWALGSVVSPLDVGTDVLTSRPAPARWGGRDFLASLRLCESVEGRGPEFGSFVEMRLILGHTSSKGKKKSFPILVFGAFVLTR